MKKLTSPSTKPDSRGRLAYKLREVSELIGVPVTTLRTMARRGELNPITSFGPWLIASEELEELLNKRLRNTGHECGQLPGQSPGRS